jgi:hypothetical protein
MRLLHAAESVGDPHPFYSQRTIRACRGRPTRPGFRPLASGCVVWDGAVNSKGYAVDGNGLIHREAWMRIRGEIPLGYQLHHVCKEKTCALVTHLQLVTPEEHAVLEGFRRLNEATVIEILDAITQGIRHADIAERFGISRPYVSLLKLGKRWNSVSASYWLQHGIIPFPYVPVPRTLAA